MSTSLLNIARQVFYRATESSFLNANKIRLTNRKCGQDFCDFCKKHPQSLDLRTIRDLPISVMVIRKRGAAVV